MSFLSRLVKARMTEEPFTNTSVPWFGTRSRSGINVNRDRAMRISTVWSCILIKAEDIGALPVGVIEQKGVTRIPKENPVWLEKPNPETTRFQLFEQTSACIDTDGNAYWYYEKDRLGRIREVWVVPPTTVTPYRDPPKTKGGPPGPKRFHIGNEDFGLDTIVHIPGFQLPGKLRGLNPIEHHAHTLGLAAAAEEYGEAFFGNGAVMSGVIEHPNDPGKDGAERMQNSFAKDHSGLHNAHRPGVLFGGAKWVQLSIPNDNAQFLETRKYQRTDICGIFRMPPHKIGDLERATFSNIEQQEISYAVDALMSRTTRIEAAVLAAGLLEPGDQLKFRFAGRLRGDTPSRYAAYAIARQWGWLSADDIRALEDMNPLPDGAGQSYLEPLNMVPAGERPDATAVAKALTDAGVDPRLIAAVTGRPVPQEA